MFPFDNAPARLGSGGQILFFWLVLTAAERWTLRSSGTLRLPSEASGRVKAPAVVGALAWQPTPPGPVPGSAALGTDCAVPPAHPPPPPAQGLIRFLLKSSKMRAGSSRDCHGEQADADCEKLQFRGFVAKVTVPAADIPVTKCLAQRRCFLSMGQVDAKS